MSQTAEPLAVYRDALQRNDITAATGLVADLLSAGGDPVSILSGVVVRAQHEVGWLWQSGQWTTAQERSATAMAMRATTVVAEHVDTLPVTRPGAVLVTCAEREWHALPAMVVGCALRAAGWKVVQLGPSPTMARFNQLLVDDGPHAVAVSASILGSLSTCRAFIEAATFAGIPVLVGGAALGPDDVRARALGATAWAGDARQAVIATSTLPAVVPPAPPLPEAPAAEHAALVEDRRRIIAVLRERWSLVAAVSTPEVDALHSVMDVADDALHQVMNAISAALLTGDPRPLPDTAHWVSDLLTARGGDQTMIGELRDVLAATLRDYPLASRLLAAHFTLGPSGD